jgi:S-adenosylmethionine:tRNA ribosyltransferase-isomerase
VIACGSTSLRTIESSSTGKGKVVAQKGVSNLFIKPGYTFNVVDHYFTNFHQYKTSLMVLDAAFCGKDLLMESIEVAKEREYLFYEFGDAVLYI